MIRRIDHLQDFGIYRDFTGDENSEVSPFDRLNLIYGWNYSGKTTLSRVFRAIEQRALPKEYAKASFKLSLDDDTRLYSSNLSDSPIVRVFNRDYINENFQQDHSAPAVFIVGKGIAHLKRRRKQLADRHERVERLADKIERKKASIETEVSNLGTNKARDISNLLGDRGFRRPNLDQRIAEIKQDPLHFIQSDEKIEAMLATLRSGDSFVPQAPVNIAIPDIKELARKGCDLLAETASNRAIAQIKNNTDLESWIRLGLPLHENTDTCGFCGSKLESDRIDLLKGHFSQEYESLLKELNGAIKLIKAASFNPTMPHERELIPEVRPDFIQLKKRLASWIAWAIQLQKDLLDALEAKKLAVETSYAWGGNLTRISEAQDIIEDIRSLVFRNDGLVRDIGKAKAAAKRALEQHYAAFHYQEHDLSGKEKEIGNITTKLRQATLLKTKVNSAIREADKRISKSSIGASKLRELLKYLLPGSDIDVESVGESEFRFLRSGQPATNLSDGEKTALTFAYFIISLEANDAIPENTIVFVDDPISSLDSNHVYAVYALIAERLEKCHQLFVSTHNSEFFNLLKGRWFNTRDRSGISRVSRGYYVSRTNSPDGDNQARIQNLPPLLKKFKSEYEFVFSHLYEFSEAETPSVHEAYTAPNLLRKFLEAYLGFRKPSISAWHEKLEMLIDSPEQRREVHKFADDASHLQTLSRTLQQPAFVASAQNVVSVVLGALESKDSSHYDSLVEVLNAQAR